MNLTLHIREAFFPICLNIGVTIALAFGTSSANAQGEFSMWYDMDYRTFVKPKVWLGADAGLRGIFSAGNGLTLYVRPTANYRINTKFNTGGGFALFDTFGQGSNVFEFRIFQTLNCTWPELKRVKFNGRFQIEERHITQTIQETGAKENAWSFRPRLQIGMSSYYFNIGEKIKNAYLTGNTEIFTTVGANSSDAFIDQVRVNAGFGQLLPKGFRYEITLLRQFSKTLVDQNFDRSPWILRVRTFYVKPRSSSISSSK